MTGSLLSLTGVHTHIGAYHILHGVDFEVPTGGDDALGRNVPERRRRGARSGLGPVRQGGSTAGIGGPAARRRRGIARTPEIAGCIATAENMGISRPPCARNDARGARGEERGRARQSPADGCRALSGEEVWPYPGQDLGGRSRCGDRRDMVEPRPAATTSRARAWRRRSPEPDRRPGELKRRRRRALARELRRQGARRHGRVMDDGASSIAVTWRARSERRCSTGCSACRSPSTMRTRP